MQNTCSESSADPSIRQCELFKSYKPPTRFSVREQVVIVVALPIETRDDVSLWVVRIRYWLFLSKASRGVDVFIEHFAIAQPEIGGVLNVAHSTRHSNRKSGKPDDGFFIAADDCGFELLPESFEAIVTLSRIARGPC